MESAATGGAAHPPGACDPPQNCGGYMSLVGHWEEAKFPAGINLVQTMAPGWRQIVSEVALDLITIPAVSALPHPINITLSCPFITCHPISALESQVILSTWTSFCER